MTDAQKWLCLAGLLVCGWLLYLLAPVLNPFLVAAALAYLGDPVVDRLEGFKLSRTLSVVIVFLIMIAAALGLVLILFPLLQDQIFALLRRVPTLIDWLQSHLLPLLSAKLGIDATVTRLARDCDAVLAEFLRGQLMVMLALALIYTVGLWLAGLESALLIGLGAGLVSFIPYLGSITGIVVAGIAAFLQFHDVLHLVYVGLVFGIGQSIEGMVLSPLLVGERIGLHPVAVIFAIMAGGQLFGFFGVLLALPAAAVITVLLRFAHARYTSSGFYTP
ncbi:MAG: AI-2E family transporter [Gammaproteobacteria bacterium]